MRRSRDFLIVGVMTAASTVALTLAPASFVWLRVAIGLPFALLLPGLGLMLMCDPERRLGGLEWFALSLGGSLAITAFAAMSLAATVGLTAQGATAVLAVMTLGEVMIAWAVSLLTQTETVRTRGAAWDAWMGSAALVAGALLVLALSVPQDTTTSRGTTQLWGVPGSTGDVRIGARNVDAPSARFLLTVDQGGRMITTQRIDMPAGTQALFDVKASAMPLPRAPITAVLTDERGTVGLRTISVWPRQ